jgi:flagellar basal-body rod modification protein FlgD
MAILDPLIFSSPPKAADALPSQQLGKNDFLNLLMVQLRNQDPMNVQDDKEFISQMAQFSSLEQTTNLSVALENMVGFQQLTQGSALLGKQVEAIYAPDGENAETVNGVVTETRMISGVAHIVVDDQVIPMSNITRVTEKQ